MLIFFIIYFIEIPLTAAVIALALHEPEVIELENLIIKKLRRRGK